MPALLVTNAVASSDIHRAIQHECSSICTMQLPADKRMLHAVVRTEEGRTFPYSFTDKELKHNCGNGRFPCASAILFIKAQFCI